MVVMWEVGARRVSWRKAVSGHTLAKFAGHGGTVTSASNDVVSNPICRLSGCVSTDRKGLLGRLRKLYI